MDAILLIQEWAANWKPIDADRFLNAAIALLLACLVGGLTGPRGNSALPLLWRPVIGIFGALASRLDRKKRKEGSRIFRGFFLAILLVVFFGLLGVWIKETLQGLSQGRILEIVLLSLCLTCGAVWTHILAVMKTLKGTLKQPGTYLVLSRTSRLDLSARDDFTLTRTSAELLVRMFDKACVAPVVWYLLTGLPGALIYMALSAYVWRTGYDGTRPGVSTVAAGLEHLMGIIPSHLTALLIAATTLLVPGSGPVAALRSALSGKKHPYGQGGAPLSVLAHALNLVLCGPVTHLDGTLMNRAWTGPKGASAQLSADYLKRVLYMVMIAHLYFFAALVGGSLWAQINGAFL